MPATRSHTPPTDAPRPDWQRHRLFLEPAWPEGFEELDEADEEA